MKPKHKVYYLRVTLSAVVGLLSGVFGLSAPEGLTLFLFTYFLVTPLSLKLWGKDLKDMGLMKIYREGLGSSLLSLLLIWTLVINLLGPGVTMFVVRATSSGAYPIQTIDGRTVAPDEHPLEGYNAALISFDDKGNVVKVLLGAYTRGNQEEFRAKVDGFEIDVSGGEASIRATIDLKKSIHAKRAEMLFGNVTVLRNGTMILNGTKIGVGEKVELTLGARRVLVHRPTNLTLEVELTGSASGIDEFPLNVFIAEIVEKDGFVFVFDPIEPVRRSRTARVDDSYLVVLREG